MPWFRVEGDSPTDPIVDIQRPEGWKPAPEPPPERVVVRSASLERRPAPPPEPPVQLKPGRLGPVGWPEQRRLQVLLLDLFEARTVVRATEVEAFAAKQGFSHKQLRTARRRLRVRAFKTPEVRGVWWLKLTEDVPRSDGSRVRIRGAKQPNSW